MLPCVLDFAPDRDAEIFAAVPASSAVFLLRGRDPAAEPYMGKTANLRRRLQRLLGAAEERSRKLNLRERVARIEYAPTGSDFESGFALYRVLRTEFPETYSQRLRLRWAPLVRLHLENRFPRVSITTQLSGARAGSVFYGPFASRAAAEKFANDALDFFLLRRCVEELNPDPAFPGCIYSEMKMCLAPCFKGCSDEQYAGETARVQAFFDSRGQSLARELAGERERASTELRFEEAAAFHARLDKLTPLLQQLPEITRRLDRLDGLMIQPSARADCVSFFRLRAGCLSAPVDFAVGATPSASIDDAEHSAAGHSEPSKLVGPGASPGQTLASTQPTAAAGAHARSRAPLSMEARVNEALAAIPDDPRFTSQERLEHLALLKRWYFRSLKTGEIFFTDEKGELPMRRVVRGISRVFRGEKPAGDLNETARDYWVNRGREAQLRQE